MTDNKGELARVEKNKLITLKCRSPTVRGSHPIFLMSLAEMEKKGEIFDGWILVISGNPLIPRGRGGHFSNKIHIDKLSVTKEQEKEILQNSIIQDGFVYLYAGNFRMGKCHCSGEDDECNHQQRDAIKLLVNHLNRYHVAVDFRRVVPFKEIRLGEIIQPEVKNENVAGQQDDQLKSERESKEDFKFPSAANKIFVDLECPVNHCGYHVEIYFLQGFVCKPKVLDPYGRQRITRTLEQDKILVPPNSMERTSTTASMESRRSRHKSGSSSAEKVTVRVKILEIPDFEDCEWGREILDIFQVDRIEYWVIARLLNNNNVWNGLTTTMLMVREVGCHQNEQIGFMTQAKPKSSKFYSCYRRQLRPSTASSADESSSSFCALPNCSVPFKLVIMEMELERISTSAN